MISFLNDYNEVGCIEVLNDLFSIKDEKYIGYSSDVLVKEAIEILKNELNDKDLEIHFVHSGTMANVLGLLFCLKRYESIISADTGHIVNMENASVEAVGHQIVLVNEEDGKVTVEAVKKALSSHSHEQASKPKVVYISNVTELGTIYKKKELEELRKVCDENNLYLFMDGARLSDAMVSKYNDISFCELTKYFDAFTIGGTKNGMLFGEAIVLKNKELIDGYARYLIKQRGALLAKGFLYGSQFKTMFKDGLYFKLAKNSVNRAEELLEILKKYNIKLFNEVEANLIFCELDKELHEKLSKEILYSFEELENGNVKARFVTSWNTQEEEIKRFEFLLGGGIIVL